MRRDTLLALTAALLLHAAFFWGGRFFPKTPAPPASPEVIPVIELVPVPPAELEPAVPSEPAENGGADTVADFAPPMQADLPTAVIDSLFVQPIQPPAPPGLSRHTGVIAIPTGRPGGGLGTGQVNLFNLSDLDQQPAPTLRVPPAYPFDMRRAGISGEVLVGFIVDTAGHVRDAHVVRSTQREFEDEALRAISRWRFTPGRKAGATVNTRMQVPLVFSLQTP